jgi:hypothetical protein
VRGGLALVASRELRAITEHANGVRLSYSDQVSTFLPSTPEQLALSKAASEILRRPLFYVSQERS